MDEILVANFMVFDDLVARASSTTSWIGDEAWDLDHFLHENPELKRAPFVWLTDFVGWLPMPDGGEREAALTADYNAEMVEHIARYPRLRDRSVFVGDPEDVVADRSARACPAIRDWTAEHFDFAGYITGFDPADVADRAGVRAELGYADDEKVCVVTVGGSGVGADLLRRVIDAYPAAARRVPGLRMVVVAGPASTRRRCRRHAGRRGARVRSRPVPAPRRLRPGGRPGRADDHDGADRHRRPFLYFPLRHHFEQSFHVPHRLDRYGAGRRMDYATDTPEIISAAIAEEIGRCVSYRPMDTGAVGASPQGWR